MWIFCRNLNYFNCWCIADHQNISRLTLYYVGCVSHSIEACKTCEAVLPQLFCEYHTNSNNYCRFKMKWTSLKLFHMFFHQKIRCSNRAIQTWENFQLYTYVCYLWKWTIQQWKLSSHIIRTPFEISNIGSKSDHAELGGRSLSFQTNHDPSVYAVPYHCPAAKQWKEFYIIIWWVWKVIFAMEFWTNKPHWRNFHLWDGCRV